MLSVTIRPREYNFKREWKEMLAEAFEKKDLKYVIGLELNNHLQIAVATQTRTNNFRRMLNDILKFIPEDDDEARVWLKIAKHKEPNYLVGYCCKENDYVTNYATQYIDECRDYYSDRSQDAGPSGKWIVSGMNNLMPHVYTYALDNSVLFSKLQCILALMFADDLIPLSLARKFSSKDEHLWIAYRNKRRGQPISKIIDDIENYFLR